MTADPGSPALHELFDRYHALILHSAYRITGNEQDAEDVLQTIFVRLLNRSELPDLAANPQSYLHRAAVNTALDVVRARKASRSIPLEVLESILQADAEGRPDRREAMAELRDWLRQAVSRLTPESAELFVLRFVEGYSNQEIAELHGTTAGSIAVMVHRTRMRLQREIGRMLGGENHE